MHVTNAERCLLASLDQLGASTIGQLRAHLSPTMALSSGTIRSLLSRLRGKGLVQEVGKRGRSKLFAKVDSDEAGQPLAASDRRAHLRALPLSQRLPNPPSSFTGRGEEREALRRALEGSPAVVVWGVGGIGKTALALATLHHAFDAQVPRTLYLPVLPGMGMSELLNTALLVLHSACGEAGIGWGGAPHEGIPLFQGLLDVAEVLGIWLVFDDVHHLAPEDLLWLAKTIDAYARGSRWLLIGRQDPTLPLGIGQVLQVNTLPEHDLAALAARLCGVDPLSEGMRLARASYGSPWVLKQRLAAAELSLELSTPIPRDLDPKWLWVPDLSDEVAGPLLQALLAARGPLSLSALEEAGVGTTGPSCERLMRHGWVQKQGGRLVLHELALQWLGERGDAFLEGSLTGRLEEALLASGAAEDRLLGLGIVARLRPAGVLSQRLDAYGHVLIAAGHALGLWALVRGRSEDVLAPWRFRLGCHVGERPSEASAWVERAELSASHQILYTLGFADLNEAEACIRVSEGLAERVESFATEVWMDALLARAESLSFVGRPSEANAVMASLEEAMEAGVAARTMLRCIGCQFERYGGVASPGLTTDECLAIDRMVSELRNENVPKNVGVGHLIRMAKALWAIGENQRSMQLTTGLVNRYPVLLAASREGQEIQVFLSCQQISTGQIGEAITTLTRVVVADRQGLRSSNSWALLSYLLQLSGRWREAEEALAHSTVAPLPSSSDSRVQALRYRYMNAGRLFLLDPDQEQLMGGISQPDDAQLPGPVQHAFRAYVQEVEHELAWRSAPEAMEGDVDASKVGEGYAVTPLAPGFAALRRAVWRALRGGDTARARDRLRELEAFVGSAHRHEYDGEVLLVASDVDLVSGELHSLSGRLAELGRLAASMPSARYRLWGELQSAAAGAEADYLDVVMRCVWSEGACPGVSARACALLGLPAKGPEDRLVAAAVQGRGTLDIRLVGPGEGRPTLWLSLRHQTAECHDGARHVLDRSPSIWGFLMGLRDGGGIAEAEHLSAVIWPRESYHPLRHNQRLHNIAARLRRMIMPGQHWLQTVEGGYAFACRVASDG